MAVLSTAELQSIRAGCALAAGSTTITWTKTQLNAGAQAVEDFLTNNTATVSTAINAATTPLVLTAAQKKALVAYVVYAKFVRDK